MEIKIFYHLVDWPGYEEIANDQLQKIESSGLLSNAELYMNINYKNEECYGSIKEKYKNYTNIKWSFRSDIQNQEHTTWVLMQQTAINSTKDFYALYINQKGITHINDPVKHIPTLHWRLLMDYWNIEKWKDCIDKLHEGYDAVGCLLKDTVPRHFSGSYAWTTSDFLKKSQILKLPSEVNFQAQVPGLNTGHPYRCDVEFYHGHNNAKMFSFHNTDHDFYRYEYPLEKYRHI